MIVFPFSEEILKHAKHMHATLRWIGWLHFNLRRFFSSSVFFWGDSIQIYAYLTEKIQIDFDTLPAYNI